MIRAFALGLAILCVHSSAFAADPLQLASQIRANYGKLVPFTAEISTTFEDPSGAKASQFRSVAGSSDQFRCEVHSSKGEITEDLFRDGKVWYRSTPSVNRYSVVSLDSLPSRLPFDPREAGSDDLRVEFLGALKNMKSSDANSPIPDCNVIESEDGDGGRWLVHVSKQSSLPLYSEFLRNGRRTRDISIEYDKLSNGAFFPSKIVYAFYDRETGQWTQRITDSIALKSHNSSDANSRLRPPQVPQGAIVSRLVPDGGGWRSYVLLAIFAALVIIAAMILFSRTSKPSSFGQ